MFFDKRGQLAEILLRWQPGPFLNDCSVVAMSLDEEVVDIINISTGDGLVLAIPVDHRHKLIRKHRFDRLAFDQPVDFRKVLDFILVGFNSEIAGVDFQRIPFTGAAGITKLKKEGFIKFQPHGKPQLVENLVKSPS